MVCSKIITYTAYFMKFLLQKFEFVSSPSTKPEPPAKSPTMKIINERIRSFLKDNSAFDSIQDWVRVSIYCKGCFTLPYNI